jgi:hypothetical protein
MRREALTHEVVEAIARTPEARRMDSRGNPVAVGRDATGRPVEVVLALDDPDYAITVIVRRKQR